MNPLKYVILALLVAVSLCPASAQTNKGASSQSKEKKTYKPGNAWTLEYPLGQHTPAPMDTILYNYQRQAIPSLVSDAYATTGNLGGPGQNQIYFQRRDLSDFFFDNALDAYMPSARTQKFYNVYIPMTLLSYNFGGEDDTSQDRLRATFAGNINRRAGVGAFVDYLYSKGSYSDQAAKDFNYGFSGYYNGDRYEVQAFFNHWNMLNKENGGITDELYIKDPAELQGGDDRIEPKSIPTNLVNAHSRVSGAQFFMNHAYKIGFWKDQQVNDTLTRKIYVPVLKVLYSLDYKNGKHVFTTDNTQDISFFEHTYFNPLMTYDKSSYWGLSNTVGLSMVEGFRKWVKFGLSAYATYEIRKFRLGTYEPEMGEIELETLDPLPENYSGKNAYSQNLLWIGGRLEKPNGKILSYNADVKFGLAGDVVGDIDLNGDISTRFRLFNDTVTFRAYGHFSNREAPLLMQHYISNHFVWENKFGKTRRVRAGGELLIPWSGTRLSAGFENVQNLLYFDVNGLPQQYGGSVQVFSAKLHQPLHVGIWHWDNTITLQTTGNDKVLPLPLLAIYSNMYVRFTAFKVLDAQIGFDCDYYTRYRGVNYQPATMTFRVGEDWKIGNYPFVNVYITAKLYKVRFFLMCSHVTQGLFKEDYFSMPLYPLNPRRFQFGLSIDFAN